MGAEPGPRGPGSDPGVAGKLAPLPGRTSRGVQPGGAGTGGSGAMVYPPAAMTIAR